ncbi:hypothetical protein PMAYCL1PPCAC_30580, partial [Pristionchus mayeri]
RCSASFHTQILDERLCCRASANNNDWLLRSKSSNPIRFGMAIRSEPFLRRGNQEVFSLLTNLEWVESIEGRVVFDISRGDVEAGTMQCATNRSVRI